MVYEKHQLAAQLWMIEGGFVEDHWGFPEAANVLLYQVGDRLYLLDSGLGEAMRAAIEQQLMAIGGVGVFTLLNSGGQTGRTGNNDLVHNVLAEQKEHLTRDRKRLVVDGAQVMAGRLYELSRYFDPYRCLNGNGLRQFGLRGFREVLAAFVGQQKALRWMVSLGARRWPLVLSSPETAAALPPEDVETLEIGGTAWQGWRLGPDDVWAMEAGDGLWFYLPGEKALFAPDWRDVFSPVWPDRDGADLTALLEKLMTMVRTGAVNLLVDGQHAEVTCEPETALRTAEQILSHRQGLRQALEAILRREPGMTVRRLHRRLRKLRHRPAVAWYMDAPLPTELICFEQFLVAFLLEMGCCTKGIWRHKRFYLPEV